MRYISQMVQLVFTLFFPISAFALTGPAYTGEVIPKPQEVLTPWQIISLAQSDVQVQTDPSAHKAVLLAKDLLQKCVAELSTSVAASQPTQSKVILMLGRFNEPLIEKIDKRFDLKLKHLPIKPEGYVIRIRPDNNITYVIAAGVDHRGAFYAAATLIQQIGVVDGKLILRIAEMNDWPIWSHRYIGDYSPSGPAAMEFLALYKINGFAIQHRYEWRDFNADTPQNWGRTSTYGAELKALKEFRDQTGLMDYMLVINIYADRKQPCIDITKDNDIRDLIERCKFAAENGTTHIMICVDDWTPTEDGRYICPNPAERKKFDDSVGKAHGYLMTRIFNALKKNYPTLELSVVPPVYSLLDHKAADPKGAGYLRDLAANLPADVYIAWTGPRVISSEVGRNDYLEFSRLINHHRLIFWDNSECINPPMMQWITKFYGGFATDSEGIIFLNFHAFGWPWCVPYNVNANDYLWNPRAYDKEYSYSNSIEKVYGIGTWPAVKQFIETSESLKKTTDKEAKLKLIDQLETLLKEFERLNLPMQHPAALVKGARAQALFKTVDLTVAKISTAPVIDGDIADAAWAGAASFTLINNEVGSQNIQPGQGKIAIDDKNLYLAFSLKIAKPLPITRFDKSHDETVYTSSDAIEIFFQPVENGSYGHFIFDSMGNYFDERDGSGPGSWNPAWTVKAKKSEGRWTAEVAIPLSSLRELSPDLKFFNTAWKGNFFRVYNAESQISAWCFPPTMSFHDPAFWGILNFK